MKLIAQLQLKPTPEQAAALKATLETANAACDFLSALAWEHQTFKQFDLHKLGYYATREKFPLSAEVVVRCLAKVADSYKKDKKTRHTFKSDGAIAYNHHILRFKAANNEVSIWALNGRETISFVCGEAQRQLLETQKGECDLALVKGRFYLLACCDVPEAAPVETQAVLGVDMGIVELATTSDGKSYSGEKTKEVRRRYRSLRARLQKKGTKSAKRHLKKLSRKQANFVRSENHRISKEIVKTATVERKALALENLKGIRERAKKDTENRLGRSDSCAAIATFRAGAAFGFTVAKPDADQLRGSERTTPPNTIRYLFVLQYPFFAQCEYTPQISNFGREFL